MVGGVTQVLSNLQCDAVQCGASLGDYAFGASNGLVWHAVNTLPLCLKDGMAYH